NRPKLVLYLQGPRGRRAPDRAGARCAVRARRIGAQVRGPAAHYRAARRYDDGQSNMGGPLRGCIGRRFRFAGSDYVERRGRHRTQGPAAEIARAQAKPTENLTAYDLYLRAYAVFADYE